MRWATFRRSCCKTGVVFRQVQTLSQPNVAIPHTHLLLFTWKTDTTAFRRFIWCYKNIWHAHLLLFVTKNKDQFLFNSQVHKINTRQTLDLYVPTTNLTIYQKGVYYSRIKIYNHLPTAIKDLSGDKNKFKLALKRYLLHYSFYSLEEYFNT